MDAHSAEAVVNADGLTRAEGDRFLKTARDFFLRFAFWRGRAGSGRGEKRGGGENEKCLPQSEASSGRFLILRDHRFSSFCVTAKRSTRTSSSVLCFS